MQLLDTACYWRHALSGSRTSAAIDWVGPDPSAATPLPAPQRETESLWAKGFPEKALTKLENYGFIQSLAKGEFHSNNQVRGAVLL